MTGLTQKNRSKSQTSASTSWNCNFAGQVPFISRKRSVSNLSNRPLYLPVSFGYIWKALDSYVISITFLLAVVICSSRRLCQFWDSATGINAKTGVYYRWFLLGQPCWWVCCNGPRTNDQCQRGPWIHPQNKGGCFIHKTAPKQLPVGPTSKDLTCKLVSYSIIQQLV